MCSNEFVLHVLYMCSEYVLDMSRDLKWDLCMFYEYVKGDSQGGKDSWDVLSCRSFATKESLMTGLFCGKWPIKIRRPMTLRHPVAFFTQNSWIFNIYIKGDFWKKRLYECEKRMQRTSEATSSKRAMAKTYGEKDFMNMYKETSEKKRLYECEKRTQWTSEAISSKRATAR